jgi:tryptophan-specific transport protein
MKNYIIMRLLATVPLLLVYGIIVAVCHTLYVFNLLPVFK